VIIDLIIDVGVCIHLCRNVCTILEYGNLELLFLKSFWKKLKSQKPTLYLNVSEQNSSTII
jgi:hypothetical protein